MLNTATTTSSTVVSPTSSLSAAPHTGPSVKDAAVLSPKRKRRPAGTPDPDAEVVALSPRTLLESDRYVCDICGQGFQRDQNLQMHRRRHKVPWKLLKKDQSSPVTDAAAAEGAPRKRVFVCPEPTCLHNDARHALGDLVGIKKHFRRKHSHHKKWVCEKCSKAYAVQSDYKAHLKTCGTRGHSCDCGRVFSRVESFIEHQDSCTAGSARVQPLPELQPLRVTLACPSGTMASSASQYSTDPNFSVITSRPSPLPPMHGFTLMPKSAPEKLFFSRQYQAMDLHHNLELQLQVPSSSNISTDTCFPPPPPPQPLDVHRDLALAIGSAAAAEEQRPPVAEAAANLAAADEARRAARRQIEMAEVEFANAKRIRQQAKAELESAELLREEATRKLNSTVMQITCHACKRHFQAASNAAVEDESTSLATSYVSSATTEGDGDQ